MSYDFYYWPNIQGRGEFVRLALEQMGANYTDVARKKGGMEKMRAIVAGDAVGALPFAPPFLKDGDLIIAQVANILAYLGPRHGLVPIWCRKAMTHTIQFRQRYTMRTRLKRQNATPSVSSSFECRNILVILNVWWRATGTSPAR